MGTFSHKEKEKLNVLNQEKGSAVIEIECALRASIGRFDCYDYVRSVNFNVLAGDDFGNRFVIGKMQADQVLVFDAVHDGQPLFEVFDADSQGLHEAFVALFRDDGELHDELGIDALLTS